MVGEERHKKNNIYIYICDCRTDANVSTYIYMYNVHTVHMCDDQTAGNACTVQFA